VTRILLVNIDSKIPNLALMKISAWHKRGGDIVGFDVGNPDTVYISCIFTKNAEQARGVATYYPDAEINIGGTGISLTNHLSEDNELLKPDYDLYPSTYSQGFTTRGCIRKCPFCVVPEKEGTIREAQHPSEFHDARFNTCMIMDNNLFSAPDYWQADVFHWFIENKIKMLSPQGWDIRYLTEGRAKCLKAVRHAGNVHFAWDNLKDEKTVERGIQILKNTGFNLKHDIQFYVLSGYNTTFEQDLYRCEKLKEWGTNAFVMPYRKTPEINALARWANKKWLYWSFPFSEYSRQWHRPGRPSSGKRTLRNSLKGKPASGADPPKN